MKIETVSFGKFVRFFVRESSFPIGCLCNVNPVHADPEWEETKCDVLVPNLDLGRRVKAGFWQT